MKIFAGDFLIFEYCFFLKGLNPGLAIAEIKKLMSGHFTPPSKDSSVIH